MDKHYEQFKNPDSIYRPAPFWIWNEEMDSKETCRQLKEMKEHGFGGGFAHVRLGLISPYLGEEFFKCWGETLQFCKENDIKLYMYDENGWPSGFAGGKVVKACPETWMCWACYRIVDAKDVESIPERLRVFMYDEETNTVGKNMTAVPADHLGDFAEKYIVFFLKHDYTTSWCGHFPFADLSNPATTQEFLKCTYDEYYKRFGDDFGTVVPAVFSDESNISGVGSDRLIYSDVVSKKFQEMHGYRIEDNFAAVCEDFNGNFDKDPTKVRYDFNCTISQLWIDSFVKPITKWCEEHGVAWTGHDQEHSWPQTKGGAFSEQRTYEYRQWPGMDWLLCDALREDDAWNDTILMDEIRSSANQFNKERTLVEAYGAAGWHSTFKDYKRIGDWLLVHGLNFFAHHLTHYSIIGSRKRDCPQSFDWREPWWGELTEYNDYLSRASYLLSQGKQESRILYLNTTTTGYLVPASKQKGMINHTKGFDAIKNPDMSDFLSVMQAMQDEQWDYDIGDEFSIADNVSFVGNKIKVGAMTYDAVLISDSMKNIRKETAEILKTFAANGGKIIASGNGPEFISGEKCECALCELKKSWTIVDGAKGVIAELERTFTKRITSTNGWVRGVAHLRKVLDDGREVYFFTNHSMKTFATSITLKGNSVAAWDLYTGEKHGIEYKKDGENITFDLELEWMQSVMLVVNDEAEICPAKPKATKPVELSLEDVALEKENNMILDNIALNVNGKSYPEVYYLEASETLYRERGAYRTPANPWEEGIQVGSELIDKVYGEGTGFTATYRVKVKEGALNGKVYVAIERPNLMKLCVNGNNAPWTGEGHYLDYKMGRIDVTDYIKEGENEFVVWTDIFDIKDELEILILEGDFGVEIENERFVICKKPEKLTLGSLFDQKVRFYPNAVNYTFKCKLDKKPESARLVMNKYEASALSVTVNGNYAGVVGRDGDDYAEIADWLVEGENTVTLRLCASFRNLFGAFIDYKDQTVSDWSGFKIGQRKCAPKASEYSMIDYGMFEAPELLVNE
ncbi:MAG: hypothetical protein E7312_04215 [Clostridiales bacterium]|nr:hypothetical protein [Clostridiales bacterium]